MKSGGVELFAIRTSILYIKICDMSHHTKCTGVVEVFGPGETVVGVAVGTDEGVLGGALFADERVHETVEPGGRHHDRRLRSMLFFWFFRLWFFRVIFWFCDFDSGRLFRIEALKESFCLVVRRHIFQFFQFCFLLPSTPSQSPLQVSGFSLVVPGDASTDGVDEDGHGHECGMDMDWSSGCVLRCKVGTEEVLPGDGHGVGRKGILKQSPFQVSFSNF